MHWFLKIASILFLLSQCIKLNAQCWQSISAGTFYTLAIKQDGTLWAWGINSYGQLGDGTFMSRNIPTQIGTDANWQSISAGESHSLAVKQNGTLWAWGYNGAGALGDGTFIAKNIPTQIGSAVNWNSVNAEDFIHWLSNKMELYGLVVLIIMVN